jgi:hypothetical protein
MVDIPARAGKPNTLAKKIGLRPDDPTARPLSVQEHSVSPHDEARPAAADQTLYNDGPTGQQSRRTHNMSTRLGR